jgi:GNAT superfamily N-acetyltransferase
MIGEMPELTPDEGSVRARMEMLEELQWTVVTLADEMRRSGSVLVVRSHSLDKVWALNQIRFTDSVDFEQAVALADEHMAGSPFRHIVVEDEVTGLELESPFRSAGWAVERDVLMILDRQPDRVVDEEHLVELSEQQMITIMKLWALEEHVGIQPDRLDQLMEYNRRVGRLWNERCFGVLSNAGDPIAITKLRIRDRVAWVEDVYTVPSTRGCGHARMLVTHAAQLARSAGSELTFIIADDDDWPKDLYKRIGFEPAGLSRTFRLRLDPMM